MPDGKCILVESNGRLTWQIVEELIQDNEIHLIVTALRQAFRYSKLYTRCLEQARVETTEGIRYTCATCGGLFKKSEVQVDHITPIMPLTGEFPPLNELVTRVWTKELQIVDKMCHTAKTTVENKQRKAARLKNAFDDDGRLKFEFSSMSVKEFTSAHKKHQDQTRT